MQNYNRPQVFSTVHVENKLFARIVCLKSGLSIQATDGRILCSTYCAQAAKQSPRPCFWPPLCLWQYIYDFPSNDTCLMPFLNILLGCSHSRRSYKHCAYSMKGAMRVKVHNGHFLYFRTLNWAQRLYDLGVLKFTPNKLSFAPRVILLAARVKVASLKE